MIVTTAKREGREIKKENKKENKDSEKVQKMMTNFIKKMKRVTRNI